MLKSITNKSEGRIVILDMICFEYLILAFDKLVEWTGTGKTDKIKIREKVLGAVENHRIDLSKVGKTIVEKTADSLKKLAVAVNKSLIDYQKPAIEKKKYNEPSKANILKVYDEIEKNRIFGTKKIKEILDCSPSTARAVMTKLRDMKVVKAVNGKGKGKYVFIE